MLTRAQRELLTVVHSFGTGRQFTEHDVHVRAGRLISGYAYRSGQSWHGRLATGIRKGWLTREPLPKGHNVWGSRWGYWLTDEGEAASALRAEVEG